MLGDAMPYGGKSLKGGGAAGVATVGDAGVEVD